MRHLNDIQIVLLSMPDGWDLLRNRLFDLDPSEADQIHHPQVTAWEILFIEDLIWANNIGQQLFMKVGWYPDADPSGQYRLTLRKLAANSGFGICPEIMRFETRSLRELLVKISNLAEQSPSPKSG